MAKKYQITDDSFAIGNGWSMVSTKADCMSGVVVTPHGLVEVVNYKDDTRLQFVSGGYLWRRYYRPGLTERGAISRAHAFARAVVA